MMNVKDILECVFVNGEYQGISRKEIERIGNDNKVFKIF
jgi:hypothetical protein